MGYFFIILAMLIWSTQGVIIKLTGEEPHVILFYTIAFALLMQTTIFISKSNRKAVPPIKQFPQILLLCFFITLNSITFFYAYAKTSIANAVFTHYIAPIVVAILAPILLKERITLKSVLAIAIATIGLWVLLDDISVFGLLMNLGGNNGISTEGMGLLAGIVSGFAYGTLIVLVKTLTLSFNRYVLVFFQNLIMAIFLLPFVHVFPVKLMWVFVLMGIFYATIATYIYYKGLSMVEANKAAVLGYIEPLAAIITSMLVLSEYPKPISLIGGGLIVLSGYLVISNRQRA
ncbi:MAG: DMT family transporter [Candidatus Magnetoovum sp. WYHC-5]|nr:DMT family transporter [Candidatus Magnetoovum sp. WYHC-5]